MRFPLVIWFLISTALTSFGSIYYSVTIKRIHSDIYRILLFAAWFILCIALPALLLLWVLSIPELRSISSFYTMIAIMLWVVPLYVIGYFFKKNGYFSLKKSD